MKKNDKYDLIFPIIIGILALAVRLSNVISIGAEYYANILSDASTYRLWAAKLAAGSSYGDPVFQMGPLYPYFLSLLLKIGLSFYSILILQSLMGTFVSIVFTIVAKRLFGRPAGFISGIYDCVIRAAYLLRRPFSFGIPTGISTFLGPLTSGE